MHRYREPSTNWSFIVILIGVALTWVIALYIKREQTKKKNFNRQSKILITGACKGVGRELALLFARRHRSHIVVFDSDKKGADGLSKLFFFVIEMNNLIKWRK